MPLNWNVEKVEDYEDLKVPATCEITGEPIKVMDSVTRYLIECTVAIGMGEITKKNYVDFYVRLKMGGWADNIGIKTNDGKERPLKLSDVERRIGLGCNVSFDSKATFLNNLYSKYEHQARGLPAIKLRSKK